MHTLIWNDYGFKMELNRKAFSDVSHDKFNITISAIKSGNVLFPSNSKPVSAIYGIQTVTFSEPVTVEFQHCCNVNVFTNGSLVFAVTSEASKPPYEFEKLEGGFFPEGQYGRVTTAINGSSLFVILLKQDESSYLAYFVYEHQKTGTKREWKIHIAVVLNSMMYTHTSVRRYVVDSMLCCFYRVTFLAMSIVG